MVEHVFSVVFFIAETAERGSKEETKHFLRVMHESRMLIFFPLFVCDFCNKLL